MNSQSTPVHIRLWHKDFWLMVIANLLLSMSMTLLIPTFPKWMLYVDGLTVSETGIAMGAFAVGLFLLGGFCSFLVQHYRRNWVCVVAMLLLALTLAVPYYGRGLPLMLVVALRLVQGMCFGIAQMVLASTLIIDTCDSYQRTEGNHSATWFGRFALSLGPMIGLMLYPHGGYGWVALASVGCLVLASLLVLTVHFPFRVPADDYPVFSLDRFFLVSGWPLFAHLVLVTTAVGMLFTLPLTAEFYGFMMAGFFLALLAQQYVFPDAELKSEVVTGLLLITASLLIMIFAPQSPLCSPLLGLGIGIVGTRFLLFFIKLCRHCQRGTSQSTFQLGWESGIAIGIGLGYYAFGDQRTSLLHTALALIIVALAVYTFILHHWFINHKNR